MNESSRGSSRQRSQPEVYTATVDRTTRPSIGIIGDFNPSSPTHRFTSEALEHIGLDFAWVHTDALRHDPRKTLASFDGLWIAPGSPYRSMDGVLKAIRYARERGVPLVGT